MVDISTSRKPTYRWERKSPITRNLHCMGDYAGLDIVLMGLCSQLYDVYPVVLYKIPKLHPFYHKLTLPKPFHSALRKLYNFSKGVHVFDILGLNNGSITKPCPRL